MRAPLALVTVVVCSGCTGPSVNTSAADGVGPGTRPASPSAASRATVATVSSGAAPTLRSRDILPGLDRAGPGWRAGRRYGYRVTLGTSVSFAGRSATDYELSGSLRLTCITSRADETTLRVELESFSVDSKLPEQQAELERGLPELAAPFFVTFERGIVSALRIAPQMSPTAVGTYRSLTSALQFAQPVGFKQAWQARERDTTGEYLAQYRRDPGGSVHKRKLRYLSLLLTSDDRAKPPASFLPDVVSSRAELRASREGQPLLVELQERVALRQLEAPMLADNRVSLRWVSDEPAAIEDSERTLADTRPLRVDEAYAPKADVAALDAARIAGKSFDAITLELATLPRDAPNAGDPPAQQPAAVLEQERRQQRERQTQRLIVALAATFRQQPETIEQASDRIKAGASIRSELLDGLSASGTEASQAAMVRLLESSRGDAELRHAIVFALSRTPKPSVVAIRALTAQLDDEYAGTQALYGLGTFCRRLREAGDAAGSEELGRLLLQRLSDADSELAVTRVLRAISNSGYSPALAVVKPLLDDPREAVRADALEAVRLMDSSEVDQLLVSRLAADGAVKAQLAALNAFSVRKPTSVLAQALATTLRSSDPHVRYRAVEVAAAWLERRPELRPALALVVRRDREEKIRKLAASSIGRARL
jgi:hypothetical protein